MTLRKKSHNIQYGQINLYKIEFMRVLRVLDRVNVSAKNGKSYHNCTLTVGVPRVYEDGTQTIKEYSVRLTSNCVEQTCQRYNLRSIEELKGREVKAYRSAPIFLSDFEKQYNVVLCDTLVVG